MNMTMQITVSISFTEWSKLPGMKYVDQGKDLAKQTLNKSKEKSQKILSRLEEKFHLKIPPKLTKLLEVEEEFIDYTEHERDLLDIDSAGRTFSLAC
jgi:hypothetical protein